jgi:hypothetical protein
LDGRGAAFLLRTGTMFKEALAPEVNARCPCRIATQDNRRLGRNTAKGNIFRTFDMLEEIGCRSDLVVKVKKRGVLKDFCSLPLSMHGPPTFFITCWMLPLNLGELQPENNIYHINLLITEGQFASENVDSKGFYF